MTVAGDRRVGAIAARRRRQLLQRRLVPPVVEDLRAAGAAAGQVGIGLEDEAAAVAREGWIACRPGPWVTRERRPRLPS